MRAFWMGTRPDAYGIAKNLYMREKAPKITAGPLGTITQEMIERTTALVNERDAYLLTLVQR